MLKIFCLAILIVLFVKGIDVDPTYTFADYVRQFRKTYSAEEYKMREAIFNANFQRILDKAKEKNKTYEVSVNKFTDWTDQEKTNYATYKPQNLKLSFSTPPLRLGASTTVTPIDYRALGKVT